VNYDNAIKSYAMIKLLEAGGAVAFAWGGVGDGASDRGLWTDTYAGGGQPLPWYYSYKAFKDDFAPGTQIYKTAVSPPGSVEVLASDSTIMLVNKTPQNLTVSVNGATVALGRYQVSFINYFFLMLGQRSTLTGLTVVISLCGIWLFAYKRRRRRKKLVRRG
jgi:hypothetical protein